MASDDDKPRRPVTQNTAISIGLAIVIIGGVVSNLLMWSGVNERGSVLEVEVRNVVKAVEDVKRSVDVISTSFRAEITFMSQQIADLRERVVKLESRTEQR